MDGSTRTIQDGAYQRACHSGSSFMLFKDSKLGSAQLAEHVAVQWPCTVPLPMTGLSSIFLLTHGQVLMGQQYDQVNGNGIIFTFQTDLQGGAPVWKDITHLPITIKVTHFSKHTNITPSEAIFNFKVDFLALIQVTTYLGLSTNTSACFTPYHKTTAPFPSLASVKPQLSLAKWSHISLGH